MSLVVLRAVSCVNCTSARVASWFAHEGDKDAVLTVAASRLCHAPRKVVVRLRLPGAGTVNLITVKWFGMALG